MNNEDGAPPITSHPRCVPCARFAGGAMLRLLALVSFASAQTGSLEPTPEGTNFPSITPYPTLFPSVTGHPTLTIPPSLVPSITSFPSSATGSPTLSLYPTLTSDNKSRNGTCSLCDAGETMETPDQKIPPSSADFTCADLDAELGDAGGDAGSAACEAALGKVDPTLAFVEMQAFCGCSGSRPPDLCTFCETGFYVPTSNNLNVVEVPGIGNVTCEQASAFTPYIRSEQNCLEWSLALNDPCCAKGSAAPSLAPAPAPSAPSAPSSPTAPTPPTSTSAGGVARSCAGIGATLWGMAVAVALLSY